MIGICSNLSSFEWLEFEGGNISWELRTRNQNIPCHCIVWLIVINGVDNWKNINPFCLKECLNQCANSGRLFKVIINSVLLVFNCRETLSTVLCSAFSSYSVHDFYIEGTISRVGKFQLNFYNLNLVCESNENERRICITILYKTAAAAVPKSL